MALGDYIDQAKTGFIEGCNKLDRWLPAYGQSVQVNTMAYVVFHSMAIYLLYQAYEERSVMFTVGGLVGFVGSVSTIGMRKHYSSPIAAKPYQDLSNPAIGIVIKGIYIAILSAALYSYSFAPKKIALTVGLVTGALLLDTVLVAGVWLDKRTLSHIRSVRERVVNFVKPLWGQESSKTEPFEGD